MRIGVPKEVKPHEYRVAITPAGVRELVAHGHRVAVQRGAGLGSAVTDEEYAAAGAVVEPDLDRLWADAELILKVKEPIAQEYGRLHDGLLLFGYLHLAADPVLTGELLSRGVTALAYETVQLPDRGLPLLAPMSEVAGRLAPQVGASALLSPVGGRGVLLAGVPGVVAGNVVVIGAGVSGMNAARIAVGMGARVTLLDRDPAPLAAADRLYGGALQTLASTAHTVENACLGADLVIGAVLVPGAKAPTLVSNDLVARMRPGSVLVDLAVDQGGCFADSRPTTHDRPTYRVHESVFYCVANMPGAVPATATSALTNATLRYTVALADRGLRAALTDDPSLARGLNTYAGRLTNTAVGAAVGLPAITPGEAVAVNGRRVRADGPALHGD